MAGTAGLEPAVGTLTGTFRRPELRSQNWSPRMGSNHRLPDYRSGALPTELHGRGGYARSRTSFKRRHRPQATPIATHP